MIKKAVLLAAGLGTRLRPFTCATPKPLLPVWGVTMLDRILAQLRERGVTDVVVNAHHLHEQVEAWAAANGVRVSYEPEILGSGGALNPLRDWIAGDPFWLVNGDIVVENAPDLSAAFAKVAAKDDVLGVCLATEQGPRTVEVEPESQFVTNWKSDDAGVDGTYTYCGVAILKPQVLDFVAPSGFSSVVSAYEKAMMEGRFMKVVRSDDLLWEDAGTIERYVDLNRDGEDNAFADVPQLRATGATDFAFLSARGSERVFFSCDKGIAILYDDGNREENGKYAGFARWLKAKGVSVPEVVYDDPATKTLVLENAGSERKMTLEDYVKVVEALAAFNALGAADDLPANLTAPFDAATWKWEHDLFAKHCLGTRFGRTMSDAVAAELRRVADVLEQEPKALVHRDFQSTNVLWKGDRFTFIDFQGMRLGPAAYDVASLVYDPYAKFTEGERRALVALYAKKSGRGDGFAKVLPFAAVQRLVQCLGAYGRLASVGQPQFGKFVLPGLENLLDAADKAGLDAVGALAEDLIAEEQHRGHHHDAGCNCGRPRTSAHTGAHDESCSCGHHHGESCSCGHHHHGHSVPCGRGDASAPRE